MAQDEATFELWRRGELVESFTGPRSEAKARAEAKLHGYKMSDLAFVKELTAEEAETAGGGGTSFKKVLTVIFYVAIGLFAFWLEFF